MGIGAQTALANPFSPEVGISASGTGGKDFILAGEDATFEISISNSGGGKQFNLGLTALLPDAVDFVSAGSFGTPTAYPAGSVLPNVSRTSATTCVDAGLIPASALTPPGPSTKCAVPEGLQLWVWSNVDDLPDGATVTQPVTVRPDASVYPVGAEIGFDVTAYTSDDPTRLPTFDGSPSKARTSGHTSGGGKDADFAPIPVKALRVTKTEPSPEEKLLRGVHTSVTTYTIELENTGEGVTGDVIVTDYLPAGLEYLGVSGGDHSADEEYPGSGPIPGTWTPSGEMVETVQLSATEATALGLQGAGVYTKVTWTLPAPLTGGTPQELPATVGTPGTSSFTYEAAVPLFANELWADGTAPDPASGLQAANLDNNTGASTRHGSEDPANPATGQMMRNAVVATGTYAGEVQDGDESLRTTSDTDTEEIYAVDLRVLKSVATDDSGNAFATGKLATYSLDVSVSEYVDAREITLTDVMPNGLCPAFPAQPEAPSLTIRNGQVVQDLTDNPAQWSSLVAGGTACNYPSTEAGARSDGATVTAIEYDVNSGTFTSVFTVEPLAALDRVTIDYTAMQRPFYSGDKGSTSSGDRLTNRVEITGITSPIDAIAGDPELAERVGGDRYPKDESRATITSRFSELTKTVLGRGIELADAQDADWTTHAETPFSPGDLVWYRVEVPFAKGIDTRNPILDDYLPVGVDFEQVLYTYSGIPGFAEATEPAAWSGDASFPAEFIPDATLTPAGAPTHITWELGRELEDGNGDRFMPLDSQVTFFIQGRIATQSVSADDIDSPANQAKYQQVNVDGEISFLRREALIDLDWGSTLQKGIRTNPHPGGSTDAPFNAGGTNELVVQGDEVVYRLDVTAPQNTTSGYVVWDVLPEGVTAADVGTVTAALVDNGAESPLSGGADFSAVVYDPTDTLPGGLDLNDAYADRSVIVWNVSAEVPGSDADPAVVRGLTLGYTLTVPEGAGGAAARLTQRYDNTAGIISYEIPSAIGAGTTTVVPQREGGGQELTNRTVQAGEVGFDDADTYDDASIYLPNATMEKNLVSTEITPADDEFNSSVTTGSPASRPDDAIVQGEHATFEYSVTIPARTSVSGAKLADDGQFVGGGHTFDYEFVPGSATFSGPTADYDFDAEGFTLVEDASGSETPGTLVFPSSYTNTTADPQTFSVQITVWVQDRDAAHPAPVPNLAHNTALTNTARFEFSNPNTQTGEVSLSDDAQVRYLEPNLDIVKSADPSTDVTAEQEIEYSILVQNTGSRPQIHDNVVVDTVPAGLLIDTTQPSLDGATFDNATNLQNGLGGTITWTPDAFPELATIPTSATLTYVATIDPDTGGGQDYVNDVDVTGYTLPVSAEDPDPRRGVRTDASSATVTAVTAGLEKGVRISPSTGEYAETASAPIGATAQYEVEVTLYPNVTYYDVVIEDVLPAGAVLQNATISGPTVTPADAQINNPANWQRTNPSGTLQRWTYTGTNGDFPRSTEERTLTLRYDVLLSNTVPANVNALPNTATFEWANTAAGTSRESIDRSATVSVLNPALAITKKVDGQDSVNRNPDATLPYRLTVTNTGGTPAHNITVTDAVPTGVVVDPATISNGGTLAGAGANGGGTITWTLTGPLDHQSGTGTTKSIELTYSAEFADSSALTSSAAGLGATLTNTARVTRFESFPSGGRVYQPGTGGAPAVSDTAVARALFPIVTLAKSVSDDSLARVDESFGWRLTLVNTGQGSAQTVQIADVLPQNWSYDANSARISVGGAASVPLAEPVLGEEDGKTTLTWDLGSSAPSAPILPGTASGATPAQRTIVVTLTATPSAAATTDSGVGINVNPHVNTLRGSATDTTGATGNGSRASYVADPTTANAYLGSADLAIVKQGAEDPFEAGTSGVGWTIDVSNLGPDAAEGPITVTDTTGALPTGITVTGASGTGWTCDVPNRAADGVTTFACERINTSESLASGASFPTINVQVAVADDQAPAEVGNTASVASDRTFDPVLSNNEDDATIGTTTSADLALTKSSNTTTPTAGAAITWQLTPRNVGPSVSLSTDGSPITITDTVPAGVNGVTFTEASGTWTATPPEAGSWNAGDTITWTYSGASMPTGAAPAITLTGTIDAGWTGGDITNAALINPGETPDPDYVADPESDGYDSQNNLGTVTVTPGDAATHVLSKTRVVWDAETSTWVPAAEGSTVEWGDDVSYRLTVVNAGPANTRNVTVVDKAPAGLTYVSHVSEQGTWTHTSGGTDETGATDPAWDTFALDGAQQVGAAQARSFVVTYATDSTMDPDTDILNLAVAQADNAEPSIDDDNTGSTRVANLSVEKSHTGVATAGSSLDYTIVATNHGPSVSDGPIVLSDALPDGFSYVAGSAQVSVAGAASTQIEPTISGQTLSWTPVAVPDTLPVGATISITLTTAIAPDVAAQVGLVNTATVSAPNDPDPSDDTWTDPTEVVTQSDMVVAKSVEEGPWIAGTNVSYTVNVWNNGPSVADATITDTLPAGLTLVSASSDVWDCSTAVEGASSVECTYPQHPVNAQPDGAPTVITVVAALDAAVPSDTVLTNVVDEDWVDSRGPHSVDADAAITVSTIADLGLTKTAIDETGAEVTTAVAGEQARYRIDAHNYGPSNAVGPIVVTDVLPAGVSFVGLAAETSANWSAEVNPENPQEVVFTLQPTTSGLANASDAPAIVFDVLLDAALPITDGVEVTPLVNTATVVSGTPEPAEEEHSNTDTAELSVGHVADLSVAKRHSADAVRIGDPLDFTLTVTNGGPSVSSGARVVDTVPEGLFVTSEPGDLGNGWVIESVTPENGAATVTAVYTGTIEVAATTPDLVISTTVMTDAYPGVTNVAVVSPLDEREIDPNPENDRAEDPVVVPPLVTLVTEKRAVGTFQVGKTGTFTISVSNLGPTEDPGPITVTDVLPNGMSFRSSPDAGVSVRDQTVTWTLEEGLQVGETVELTLEVNIGQAAYPTATNTVSVDSQAEKTPDSVLSDAVTVPVAAADPLAVTGNDLGAFAALAALLLLLGGAGVLLSRRRKTAA
ncbi:DUF11 domain-containing protein [Leucobacter rhizosphaerae]|uniref:DUF11 domain-containing protein n=1 Tax=Leucobacter rhizosphaerae TaxID=2932245 RepID=A0ABY4G025_9MICO|nr:DUF11 domain-containing protein [Leucobacter rhizosphaerae]UOQ61901.1 DUF11 domain-containing protein [Leucobacter rhizosphaerae]